jgi:hypothetical protein
MSSGRGQGELYPYFNLLRFFDQKDVVKDVGNLPDLPSSFWQRNALPTWPS